MSLFKNQKYDRVLLLAILALVLVGIVMITSIGVPKSIRLSAPDLTYGDCADDAVDCYLILKKHLVRAFLGLIAMVVAWKLPYKAWKTLAPLFYLAGVILLVYVLFAGDENGTFAKSWINIPGLPSIDSLQPSEIAKLGLIFYLSYFLSEKISHEKLQDFKEGFLKFGMIAGLIIGLIVLQPDVGSAIILSAIAGVIYYIGGANLKHIFAVLGIGAIFALVAIGTQEHIRNRVASFFDPSSECDGSVYCWQTYQADIAIGSGGFWGRGLTQGIQKQFYLPQAVDDFIFAATSEELGFVRMSLIVLLYATIAYRGFQIANHAPNKFSMLLATGISTWITIQAFVNIMVNTALFPITGVTLPFMSYGGSSMVMTLFAMGVLLNISQSTTHNEYSPDRRRDSRARYTQSRYSGRYSRL